MIVRSLAPVRRLHWMTVHKLWFCLLKFSSTVTYFSPIKISLQRSLPYKNRGLDFISLFSPKCNDKGLFDMRLCSRHNINFPAMIFFRTGFWLFLDSRDLIHVAYEYARPAGSFTVTYYSRIQKQPNSMIPRNTRNI